MLPGEVVPIFKAYHGSDALFEWSSVPGATGFHVWYVSDKREIDLARAASAPPAIGVLGCSPPAPTLSSDCRDVGAIPRTPQTLFYQVRAACGASSEGP